MATYEIIIKSELDGDDSNLAGSKKKDSEEDNTAKASGEIKNALKYATIQSARQLVISKVGTVTRNNLLQQKIDLAMGMAQSAVAFAIDPVYGAINLGISLISQTIDANLKMEKQRNRTTVLAERAGYLNRSRND